MLNISYYLISLTNSTTEAAIDLIGDRPIIAVREIKYFAEVQLFFSVGEKGPLNMGSRLKHLVSKT